MSRCLFYGQEFDEELLLSGAAKLAQRKPRRKDSAPRKAGAVKIDPSEEDLSQVLNFFIEYPMFLTTTC